MLLTMARPTSRVRRPRSPSSPSSCRGRRDGLGSREQVLDHGKPVPGQYIVVRTAAGVCYSGVRQLERRAGPDDLRRGVRPWHHHALAIGVLDWSGTNWERRPEPVLRGTADFPNVLEPKVRYLNGMWRMSYATTPVEAGKNVLPSYQVRYVDSDDGLTWSEPRIFFSTDENYYDAVVWTGDGSVYEMLSCRSTNLFARPGFPKQGLWWLSSDTPSGQREHWTSSPVLLLDADEEAEWFGNGIFGPTVAFPDTDANSDIMYVFFAGVTRERSWWRTAVRQARSLRPPPVPAPYFFTIGRAEVRRATFR